MRGRKLFIAAAAAVAAGALLNGCYQYTPPSAALLGTKLESAGSDAGNAMLDKLALLKLADAKEIAVLNNPDYRATLHYVNAARMRYYQALGAYAPEVKLGAGIGQSFSWNDHLVDPPMNIGGREFAFNMNTTLTSSWLLFDGFARYLNVLISEHQIAREEAVRMRVLCMLKRSVAYAYFDLQYAYELKRIQIANIEFQRAMKEFVKPFAASGRLPEDSELNFIVAQGLAEVALLDARFQESIADFSLSLLMGYSSGMLPRKLEFEGMPENIERIYYSTDMCIDIALEKNPEMHIMRELMEIARLEKYKSYSSFAPNIYADFTYGNTQFNARYRDYSKAHSVFSQNSMDYGLRMEWLLFNGFARYNAMRATQALFAAAEFNMAQTYLNTVNAIRAAYSQYETAYAQYRVYRDLLETTLRQRDLVVERYRNFKASVDRVDRVQDYWITVQTQYAAAATTFQKAIAQLEAIMMIDIYPTYGAAVAPEGYDQM